MTYKTLREVLFIYVNRIARIQNVEVDPLLGVYINATLKDYYQKTKKLKGSYTVVSQDDVGEYSLVESADGSTPKRVWSDINAISFDDDDITAYRIEQKDIDTTPFNQDTIYWTKIGKTLYLHTYGGVEGSKDIVIKGSYYPVFANESEEVDIEDDYEAILTNCKSLIHQDFGDPNEADRLKIKYDFMKRNASDAYEENQARQMYLYDL